MTFELQYTDTKSNARAGLITTDHGQIQTPIFMPVGTLGTVKKIFRHRLFWVIPITSICVRDWT